MPGPVNIEDCFDRFSDTFSPKIVAELNSQHVKLVRLEGDKVPWHIHNDEDELFYVIGGELDILTRVETTAKVGGSNESRAEEVVTLHAGEFYVVARGCEHRVVPHGHVKLMLFEPAGIAHTGKVRVEITQDEYSWLE